MKYVVTTVLVFFALCSRAQTFEDSWTGYFSYTEIKDISQGDDKIYAASENAVFTYDLSTNELQTISTIEGLSGEFISTIHYSENHNLLVIGYQTGLIEIVREDEDKVLTVVDILDKQVIPPNQKNINHFDEYEDLLYIATEYGISVYNLATLEFGDTYFIGNGGSQINITQTEIAEPYIFAATASNGIKRALLESDNLIDFQQWTTVQNGNFKGIQKLGTELYVANTANTVFKLNPNGGITTAGNFGSMVDFQAFNDVLTIATSTAIYAYTEGFQQQASVTSVPGFDYQLLSGYAFNDIFYMGTKEDGILAVPFASNQAEQILPDGPLFNQSFSIDASPGQLWVNYGEITVTFNPFPRTFRGISNLREGTWTNIPYEDLVAKFGKDVNDLVQVEINPNNFEEVFMTSFERGLLQIENQQPVALYDETNSPLEIVTLSNGDLANIRLFGMDYDNQGNLWFTQSLIDNGLIKRTPEGQFQRVDVSSIININSQLALTDVKTTSQGYVFFGSASSGLLGYDPSRNKFNKITEGEGNGNLPSISVRALAVDKQNRLWIGTYEGLRVLFNTGSFFEEDANVEARAIIIVEDGVPQELLFEQAITQIVVDGSNNKWIATGNSGVFYVSSNGQETLLRFTKDNSPLPSNNIQDIAVDNFSGEVYFATNKGLVSYNGTATAPRENLDEVYAFPNPVRPGFSGNVTIDGLTANANVKITDIEGNLVFEETSEGGSVLWDTTAFGKYKVASGVYLVLISTDDALETKVAKIMIVR
ncbi:type IX secretion system anionic LPS delivery protein PorZ [Marixanthomonas spongiae]|uniref:ABC transporter substrate-binding protein n=1 Tax=Marixanthomonas spongiae TaxID=2174845 RepID=A0A2U0HZ34_9FLAO|nr:T9SS type A sorting domain-containing protein [Marixanthomonas spongiae]PVW14098.1 ABC transporter substrate-binding protein [Marixanthomonas spongiae]